MRYLLSFLFFINSFYLNGQCFLDSCHNQSSWNMIYQSFEDVLGVSPENFQLILPFIDWNWEACDQGNTNYKEYNLLNGMPVWNKSGRFQSGRDLDQAYETFLNILAFRMDSSLFMECEAQKARLNLGAERYADILEEARRNYKKNMSEPSFEMWLKNPYSKGYVYSEKIMAETKNINTQDSLYTDYLSQLRDTLLIYSRERFNKLTYRTKILDSTISKPLLRPAYATIGDKNEWLKRYNDNSLHVSWEVKSSSNRMQFIESDSGKGHTFVYDSLTFHMIIEKWGILPIKPLPWFNEALIKAKGKNPNAYRQGYAPYYEEGSDKSWVFGKGGIISSRITDLLVGYQFKLMLVGYLPRSDKFKSNIKGKNYIVKNGQFVLNGRVMDVKQEGAKLNMLIEHASNCPFFFGAYIHRYEK